MGDQFEYRLNNEHTTMRMPVPFTPDVVFIYNPSNGWLYLNTTTYAIPTTTLYDMSIPPESYVIFVPYTPNTEYAALLQAPGITRLAWDCWIEFRRGEKELDWNITPGFPVIQPLNPLPNPFVIANFEYVVSANTNYAWCRNYPLDTNGGAGWGSQGDPIFGSYVPGVGYQKVSSAVNGSSLAIVSSNGALYPVGCRPLGMEMDYQIASAPTTVGKTIQASQGSPTESFIEDGIVNGSYTDVTTFNGLEHRRITASLAPVTITDGVTTLTISHIRLWGNNVAPLTGDVCTDPLPGGIVQFTDTSFGEIALWVWSFGDGTPDEYTQNPLHVYAEDGVYNACLTVYGLYGNSDTVCNEVYVNAVSPAVLPFV